MDLEVPDDEIEVFLILSGWNKVVLRTSVFWRDPTNFWLYTFDEAKNRCIP